MNVKAVIDTNVLVSAYWTRNSDSPPARVYRALFSGTSAPTTVTHFGISVKSSVRGEVEGLREEACAEPEVPGQVPKKERKRKMKKSTKSLVWDIVKAAAAAIIGVVSAYLTGCTTINFPADDTRPTSFNGITNMRVNH